MTVVPIVMPEQSPIESELIIDHTDDDSPLDVAPDKRRVKTEKQDLPVETLVSWVNRGKLNLQPDFQRNFVWDSGKASRLIESLLLEIPIPVIYLSEETNRTYSVVDGQQRLTSICSFVNGTFPSGQDFRLSGLKVLTELNRKSFSNLSLELQEEILNFTLRLIIIEQESDPDVKFEVFERLNLGAEKLNDQEVRNCVYRGNYNELLQELAQNPHMLKIMRSEHPHPRMADRQLILRFFAMWRNTHHNYKSPFKRFLNTEMECHRQLKDPELEKMRAVFESSIAMADAVFGEHACRRFNVGNAYNPNGDWESKRLNVALWDTLLYTFSYYTREQMLPIADRVREEFLDLMTYDKTFVEYISSSTDKPERLQYRAETWRQRLDSLIGLPSGQESGQFSIALKETLLERHPTCHICWKPIEQVDDAVIAHIPNYWRQQDYLPENARLDHRFCHKSRS
ncbi:uncharacterized protein XM38_009250 [Halomicronema hongdechloris C2206]|uniref:GmrSD restriction endonucleases N-terminal domain-containing protein n=1 Tax=Halomicronema hongdechloris C2206 TaxID=1641165 RepID=A0A1Z3HI74_9CYAN|nr:DUF262 domain-containing protein [Halomicronema hongdechloris]ASC69995.1 uncharacterized protein XM38_009250 [Halomicronema hongdechloris C2206]